MVEKIVESGDLVAEKRRKTFKRQFTYLIIFFTVYYFIFLTVTAFNKGPNIVEQMVVFNLCNDIIVLLGLILYSYTIVLLRRSIAKCTSYQFETTGTYVIMSMYGITCLIGLVFLMTYTIFYFQIVLEQMIHKVVGLIQCTTVYIMLQRMGSGLKLVPHKLLCGSIQYEGYDKDNQHLFTFTLGNEETSQSKIIYRADSGFTENEQSRHL